MSEGGSTITDNMGALQNSPRINSTQAIRYLSDPLPVSMGDWWFEIATTDHFWIRRRFEVMKKLADDVIRNARCFAEIGCGNGLLQRNLEDEYGIDVAGFDLNEFALQRNVSRRSPLYRYNIHDRNPEFRAHFDVLFLFDVLEHIDDEAKFLESVKFHLADRGKLLINVPAFESLRSDYDLAAGHVRRYSAFQLCGVSERAGFKMKALSYWGLPLVPLLLLRKFMSISGKSGFDSRGNAINSTLAFLAKLEPIPQRFLGTSVMAILENHG